MTGKRWHEKCFLVLEGGGVKGTALVGGLKRLEEEGIQILGYAGSSAGAIVAALHAVGYLAEEINDIMTNKSFLDFLDGFDRNVNLRALLYSIPDLRLRNLIKIARFIRQYKIREIVSKIMRSKGLYDGEHLHDWVKKLIEEKGPRDQNNRVTFGSLKEQFGKDLRILAANVERRACERFDTTYHAEVELANAVSASVAIPIYFKPIISFDTHFVDGGIISNFPAWLFAKECSETGYPIVGLRLVGSTHRRIDSFGAYCSAIYNTIFEGANEIQNLNIPNIDPIFIDTSPYSTLDFSIGQREKRELYMSGYYAVGRYIAEHKK